MPLWNNIAELMDYYIPPLPSDYWLDICRGCNLKCIMCPQSKGLRPRTPRMSLDLFKGIIDDVCESRPLVRLYLSGEPLLHEGLFEMLEYAGTTHCQTAIHTNATMLTPELSEKLLTSPLDYLSFSFDGCSPQVYERLRCPAKFEQVESNIRQYLDLRGQNGGGGPYTAVEIIRMRETDELLQGFVEQWQTSGVDEVRIAEYMTWHGRVEDRRVGSSRRWPGYQPCAAPFRHGCVLSDGTVVPCCLDLDGQMPLGNVADKKFRDVWTGDEYRQLRLAMLTGTVPSGSLCDGCDNTFREA
ncbi:MAG: SPASM domain-containing protein [Sedimentisphaerales bacterium]|nr:SPASM domain-containing protein [Sedimentisphaerales bacterium]